MHNPKPAPREEHRPWGGFRQFTENEPTTVKTITVMGGEATSLQSHNLRSEFWRILKGTFYITIGDETHFAIPGDEFWVPVGMKHRIKGAGPFENTLLEISYGRFSENDIVRYEDRYGRVEKKNPDV